MLMLLPWLMACSSDDTPEYTRDQWPRKTIVVVVPGGENGQLGQYLKPVATWFLDNYLSAISKVSDTTRVNLQIAWIDEHTDNLTTLATSLAKRKDIGVVIGPSDNAHLLTMAEAFQSTQKPLITPGSLSERFTRGQFTCLWSLVQGDETMLKALLLQGIGTEAPSGQSFSVASLSDANGTTYQNQAPVLAETSPLTLHENERSASTAALYQYMWKYLTSDSGDRFAVCAATSADDMVRIAELQKRAVKERTLPVPPVLYGDKTLWITYDADNPENLRLQQLEEVRGISPAADPASGFEKAYEERCGARALPLASFFYDALLLSGVAIWQTARTTPGYTDYDVNKTIETLTTANRTTMTAVMGWDAEGIGQMLTADGLGTYSLRGTTGTIAIDPNTKRRLHNYYASWAIRRGLLTVEECLSDNGQGGTVSIDDRWQQLVEKKTK